jgi:hypothetical protein
MVRPTVAILTLLLFGAPAAQGQELTGTIAGRVTDQSGGAVANADVVATHVATGADRNATSDRHGYVVFTALPIGSYVVSASHAGFKTATLTDIDLHIDDSLSLDIKLEVGQVSEEISVVAEGVGVQSQSSEQSGLISGEQVRDLQLNGRSFMTLIELLAGVSSDMPDRADPNTNPSLSINGARSSASNFNIDGASNMDVIVGSSSLNTFTSIETIQEVKVMTSTFSAEYGKGGFSQVNVVTRGGTRQLRGSLYEFFRHDAMDASDPLTHQVLPLRLNNFGYTLGGPIRLPGFDGRRSRTFFFWTQEFNRVRSRGESVTTRVPTEAERRGDFSALGPGADRVFGTTDDPVVDPITGLGFPGGIIPSTRLNPNAVRLLGLYPLPNFAGPGTINYASAVASDQRWREELLRIDHTFSPAWKIYGRYVQDSADIVNPYGGTSITSVDTRFPGLNRTRATRPGKNFIVMLTNIAGPKMLNESSFSVSTREITREPLSDQASRAGLGIDIPELFPENIGNLLPNVSLGSGYATLNVSRVWLKQLYNLEGSHVLTRLQGRHVIKAGGLYSFGANREHPSGPTTNGSFSFTTAGARHAVANMLLGNPFSYTEAERLVVARTRFALFEAFVQDDFRATSRLTLNLGLRYSGYVNPWDRDNVLTNFIPELYDPARAPRINPTTGLPVAGTGDPMNGLVVAGQTSPFGRQVTENHYDLFGPRTGFAYVPFERRSIVIRGGYGRYYTRPLIGTFINNAFDNPPFSRTITINRPSFADPTAGAADAAGVPAITALGTPMRAPTIHQWSFGVQQEIMPKTIANVAYVGSRGVDLMRPVNINSPPPGQSAATGLHFNALRPYQGYGNITERQTTGSSVYHSLQVTVNRRMSQGLSFGMAYTYAKSIDNASSERGASDVPPDNRNILAERGRSDFDRRHVLTANYIWQVPGLPRGNQAARALLNGWKFSGITRVYAGKPLDVVLNTDVANIGTIQNQRPHVVADTRGPRTASQWFNIDAFARPANGTFGNMGRNSITGPGLYKWDLALFKTFRVRPQKSVEFRVEAFNAFNDSIYSDLGRTLRATATGVNPTVDNFGIVTGMRDARVMQLALKFSF